MKNKTIIKLFVIVSALFANLFIAKATFAVDAVMKITPVATSVYIDAGKTQNYQFTIENLGEEEFEFKLYTGPYSVTNEDYDADISSETSYNQITRWITFQDDSGSFVKEPKFKLAAGEKRTIVYRVSVPDDIPEGGQYCVIYAESVGSDKEKGTNTSVGIGSQSRVSLIILGHGDGNTNNAAEITDFSLTGFFSTSDIEGVAKVKNSGNTDFAAVYSFSVDSIFGSNLYEDSDNFIVLPETERKYKVGWSETPLFGIFKVKFSVKAMDVSETKSRVILIMPAFMIIILLLLLTSIIVWSIMLLRKRKERSSRLVV